MTIPLLSTRMLHDFFITEEYCVVPDLPLEFKKEKPFKEGGFVYKFDKQGTARYGIFKRNCKDPNQIKWFEMPAHYVFHYANAW